VYLSFPNRSHINPVSNSPVITPNPEITSKLYVPAAISVPTLYVPLDNVISFTISDFSLDFSPSL